MINVRVQIFRENDVCWSTAIRNHAALLSLIGHLSGCGVKHAVWDDFGHANIADGCFAVAEKSGTPTMEYTWGDRRQYCCRFAPLPHAEGKLSWEGVTPRDELLDAGTRLLDAGTRELAGPLPEEVAGHTIVGPASCACCQADISPSNITITAFDVHGAPERPATAPAPVVTVQPLLSRPTLLQRIMRLILGCDQGEAVRGP